LRQELLLAAIMQPPRGDDDGWLNIAIRDSAEAMMPQVLICSTIRRNSAGNFRMLGAPGHYTTPTPLVRALALAAHTQLDSDPEPLRPSRSKQKSGDAVEELHPLSIVADLRTRRLVLAEARATLAEINCLPPGVLPALDRHGLLRSAELPGWFVLSPHGGLQRDTRHSSAKARELIT
jgi:hypothetical protein